MERGEVARYLSTVQGTIGDAGCYAEPLGIARSLLEQAQIARGFIGNERYDQALASISQVFSGVPGNQSLEALQVVYSRLEEIRNLLIP
ncbi:MAG TPA: hypothetical protein VJL30_00775 [Patescibacteria group bacterium]|nr:MAG: hypothetical protein A3H19_02150 [Candidatus Woesebacteria bacterium RIFCSPLOWO2_12_FULL_39_9]HLB51433.1 hypothetical protein [Patescibacteria group bacterium]